MFTPFGKYVRKLRIDRGMLLKEMADMLEVTVSFVSAIENGKKAIPAGYGQRVGQVLGLDAREMTELEDAVAMSAKTAKVDMEEASIAGKETAVMFARSFRNLSESDLAAIRKIMEGKD